MKYTIGVDVGGTNIKFGLVSPKGKVVSRSHLSTKAFNRDRNGLIDAIVAVIRSLIKQEKISPKQISGVVFGLPGLINPKDGIIDFLPNIPGWKNVPLKRIVEKKLGLKVFLENDVNLIALGEWKFGAGRGYGNLICITLGTGVGGGLIFDNRLYRGEGYVAGEIGHMPLNEHGPKCACGGWGCFERYAGSSALFKRASKVLNKPNATIIEMFQLASKGNKKALKFWDETAEHLGNGLVSVVNLLNPRLIIIGGGIANNFKFLHPGIHRVIQKRAMKVQASMVKVVRGQLGDDAGIIGANVLVNDKRYQV